MTGRLFLLISLLAAAAAAAAALPWTGALDTLVYGGNNVPADVGVSCQCLALWLGATLHRAPCEAPSGHLSPGRLYRSLRTEPLLSECHRRWWPLLDKDGAVAWTPADNGRLSCRCQRSSGFPAQRRLGAAPSSRLINCICQVESGCNPRIGCVMDVGSLSCGPFQIKEPYWTDASRFAGHALGGDWKTCTTGPDNMACSTQAVSLYVGTYGPKCANPATDEVYARVHNGGPQGCKKASTIGYWNKVKACMGMDVL